MKRSCRRMNPAWVGPQAGGVMGNRKSRYQELKLWLDCGGKTCTFGFLSQPQWMKLSIYLFHKENESVLELKLGLTFHNRTAVLVMLWTRESNRIQRFVQHWSRIPAQKSPGTSTSWGNEPSCGRLSEFQLQSVLSTVWSAVTILVVGASARKERINELHYLWKWEFLQL